MEKIFCLEDLRIKNIRFDNAHFYVALENGHVHALPIKRYPRLEEANGEDRTRWERTADGFGACWPTLMKVSSTGVINSIHLTWDRLLETALDVLKRAEWKLDRLSESERQLVAIWRAEADIFNGGFLQFLCNWGVQTYTVLADGLLAIGATETLSIVKAQFDIIARFEEGDEVIQLSDLYSLLSKEEREKMDRLDCQYCSTSEELPLRGVGYFMVRMSN